MASPQLVRVSTIVAWPGATAVKVAAAVPQPAPGTHPGLGEATGDPSARSTAGSGLGWVCQEVEARGTRGWLPGCRVTVCPSLASATARVPFTTTACAEGEADGVV